MPPDPVANLRGEPALSEGYLVSLLSSLVRIKSVNPGIYEAAMSRWIAASFADTPLEVHLVESLPGRHSVAAVLRGSGPGPTLVLNGHMDTVAIDDLDLWHVDPFGGEVRDGYLWGRGACDMKAGLAIHIAVARYLVDRLPRLQGTLVCHFAIGEECAEPGTLSLCRAGFTGDVAIVTEPTGLRVATAQRGLAFYTIRIKGRSAHASCAHLGLNPNWYLRPVLDLLESYNAEISERHHPLLTSGSCTPTVVRAGVQQNAVPDYCDLVLDRRLLPGESVDGELRSLQKRLAAIRSSVPDFDFEITTPLYSFEPAEISQDSPFARRVAQAVCDVTGDHLETYGTPFASDVRILVNDAGMEAVTFGPGDAADCHCANERVSVAEVQAAAFVIAKVASDLLLAPANS